MLVVIIILYHTTPLRALVDMPKTPTGSVGSVFFRTGLVIKNIWIGITQGSTLIKERNRLEDELSGERQRIVDLESLVRASQELIDFSAHREKGATPMPAKVLLISKQEGTLTAMINVGSRDGIGLDLPAITATGALYGKVIQVSSNTSRILIITDSSATIAATLSNEPGVQSIVVGRYGADLEMSLIPQDSTVAEGDLVSTSTLEKNTPAGLLIGTVTGIHYKEGELFKTADVAPAMRFDSVENVSVLIPVVQNE